MHSTSHTDDSRVDESPTPNSQVSADSSNHATSGNDRGPAATGDTVAGASGVSTAGAAPSEREPVEAVHSEAAVNEFHARKLRERREEWQVNLRFAAISAAIVGVVLVLGAASYFYHSVTAADTFRLRAEQAAEAGESEAEARWWSQYLMMRPHDSEAMVRVALAADAAAEQADVDEIGNAVQSARRMLSSSLGSLGEEHEEERDDIRRRLIRRMLQLGGTWLREADRQVVELNAPTDDPFAHKALALALHGQLVRSTYEPRRIPLGSEDNYWDWLASQPPGVVLTVACQQMPSDADLVGALFMSVREYPQVFVPEKLDENHMSRMQVRWHKELPDVASVIKTAFSQLDSDPSGRARFLQYIYLTGGTDSEQASGRRMLMEAAPDAVKRLKNHHAEPVTQQASHDPENLDVVRARSNAYWDYQTVLEAARLLSNAALTQNAVKNASEVVSDAVDTETDREVLPSEFGLADQWYQTLIDAEIDDVTAKMRETTYLYAGLHAQASGDSDRAIHLWKEGLQQVNVDNLELRGTLVMMSMREFSEEGLEQFQSELNTFQRSILAEQKRLLRTTTSEMSQAQINEFSRQIELARWRFDVASAQFELANVEKTKSTSSAVAKLRKALSSTADVRPVERVQLATKLASLYGRLGVWDRAADALTQACNQMPSNTRLQIAAGEAWTRAGNRERAIEHWQRAGKGAAFDVRVRAAQAEFEYQLRLPPKVRSFSRLRSLVKELSQQLGQLQASEKKVAFDLDAAETSLRVLEMSLPPRGLSAEQHLASRRLADLADQLAQEKSDTLAIQAFAAERLSAVGMTDRAERRVQRFSELADDNSSAVALLQARIDTYRGKPGAAARRLLDQIEATPTDAARLARASSNYALASRDLDLAYEALRNVPEGERTPFDLYQLYRQAKQLANQSEGQQGTTKSQYESEANDWLAELKRVEAFESASDDAPGGASSQEAEGTYWRMVELENLLAELKQLPDPPRRTDPRVIRVGVTLDEITVRRPRWGRAISMRGYLAAILEKHEQAIQQLRAGIAAGDKSLRTRQVLLEELVKLGREDEANEEMQRMAMAVDFVVDPYSKQVISAAVNRGELMAAVEAAREAILDNPSDPIPCIVFARVASAAVDADRRQASSGKGRSGMTAQQRQALVDEARKRLQEAESLTSSPRSELAAAKLDLEFRHGGSESIDKVLADILESELPEHEKLVLSSRVSAFRGELDDAIDTLEKSLSIKRSLPIELQLVKLYQARGLSEDVIKTLRRAVKLQPDNQQLKEELARAIVIQDGENADWEEVKSLLSGGDRGSESGQLIYATLLGAQGDRDQLLEGLEIARGLAAERNVTSYEASVLQGAILIKLASQLNLNNETDETARARNELLIEARSVYRALAESENPNPIDLYRFAAFLVKYGDDRDLDRVKSLADQLAVLPGGMLQSLELEILYNQRSGSDDQVTDVVDQWLEQTRPTQDRQLQGGAEIAAAESLLKLGYVDQGLERYREAYENNQEIMSAYAIALARVGKHQESANVCVKHFEQHEDASSAQLLVENLLAMDTSAVTDRHQGILRKASELHPRNAGLLESIATLSMQQGRVEEAIGLYKQVLSFDPLRIRALNNLAMAYTEVPGMASEGIAPIDRAIKLTKGNPELVDTKGTVLMKAGRYSEALATFEDVLVAKPDEQRFVFHKILALIMLKRDDEARALWDTLDLDRLDRKGMTLEEQKLLEQMKQDFDNAIKQQI